MKDCMKIPRSSPTSRVSRVVRRSARAEASTSVLPEIRPELAFTTCCATSKTAIVMSKVLLTSITAIVVLKIHLKMIQVSKFARLLWSMISWMSS